MSLELILANVLTPPVLFFFLGLLATWVRSDLDIPQPLPKLLSLYLLVSIGFQGGAELRSGDGGGAVAPAMGGALLLAVVAPLIAFVVAKRRMDAANAAAVAATYGSVSAVTFIAATSFLDELGIRFGGHMVAALALMESPAIIVGVAMYRMALARDGGGAFAWGPLLRDALTNGSVFVLLGSLAIGLLTGESGADAMAPFTSGIFRGILSLFLLDMGLISGRRLGDLRRLGAFGLAFATVMPLANAVLGLFVAHRLGLPVGDAVLLTVLAASASYIAVPASLRLAIPEASPSLYVTMALAVTFPFNVVIGLPLYLAVIRLLWG